MGTFEIKDFSFQDGGLNDKVFVFHSNIKRHLSSEYVRLSSNKDDLQNELTQLTIEKDQRDRQLFSNVEKRDSRKFFTPLNVVDLVREEKDEKKKQLFMDIERIQNQINQIDSRIQEITLLLSDIDEIFDIVTSMKEQDELPSSDNVVIPTLSKEQNLPENHMLVFPQLIRNLYNLSDEIKADHDNVDVLIEYNDHNFEFDMSLNVNIINELKHQIEQAIELYDINMVLIEGEVTNNNIHIVLSYACENDKIDSLKLDYNIVR